MDNDASILRTIVKYCTDIENAMERFGNDEDSFLEDVGYQYICSFCIAQIGEVIKRLSPKLTDRYKEISWSKIAKMRDFLSHSYHDINLSIVWKAISRDVPSLKAVCERILDDISKGKI